MGIQKALTALLGAVLSLLAEFGIIVPESWSSIAGSTIPFLTAVGVWYVSNTSKPKVPPVALVLIVALLLPACRTTWEVSDPTRTMPDGSPFTLMSGSYSGRGAFHAERDGQKASVTICTDGEDNWGAVFEGFLTFRWVAAIVGEIFGDGAEPATQSRELAGFGGCDQLFSSDPEPEEESP